MIEHADKGNAKNDLIDFHLFVNDENIYFSLMDMGDLFDPTLFYTLSKEVDEHIGIRIVTEMAKEVRYFSTFKSNNLTVYT